MRIDLPDPESFKRMLEEATREEFRVSPTGISLDSREAQPGDLFVALKGERVDGHSFLSDAEKHGCVAAVVSTFSEGVELPQVVVKEPALLMGNLAGKWRSNFSLPVVGITGTNGKTTTKDLLIHTFSATFHVHGTRGNYNTQLGLPLTLLELTSHHTLSILEMGANQRGDIGYLCNLSQPRYGLITNIALSHLHYFGSLENISRSKGELFEALPSDGIAFVNGDDERVRALPTKAEKISYGFDPNCDFTADLDQDGSGIYSLTINGHHISLNSYNRTFVQNALAACAVSTTLGIDWESFQDAILGFTPAKGRCRIEMYDGITVVDDTYNANLASALAAIDLLFSLPSGSRRIVVFGDMLELGEESESHHRQVGEYCVASGVDLLLALGSESEVTVDVAKSGIDARHFSDKHQLAVTLREEARHGDIILFKASRGIALETVISEVFGP